MNAAHFRVNNQDFVRVLLGIPDRIKDEGMIPITVGSEPDQPALEAALGVRKQGVSSL
jgi:hypothetical protein